MPLKYYEILLSRLDSYRREGGEEIPSVGGGQFCHSFSGVHLRVEEIQETAPCSSKKTTSPSPPLFPPTEVHWGYARVQYVYLSTVLLSGGFRFLIQKTKINALGPFLGPPTLPRHTCSWGGGERRIAGSDRGGVSGGSPASSLDLTGKARRL